VSGAALYTNSLLLRTQVLLCCRKVFTCMYRCVKNGVVEQRAAKKSIP